MKKQLVSFIAKHLPEHPDSKRYATVERCAFTGQEIRFGVPLKSVVKSATGNIADTFRFASDVVSVETAKCFKAQRELRGNLFITETGIQRPMVSAKSALENNRPTWEQVLIEYLSNRTALRLSAVFVFSDESKKRLWVDARVTREYPAHIFFNAYSMKQNLKVSPWMFENILTAVNEAMQAGFTKHAVRSSLFSHSKTMKSYGIAETTKLENKLQTYRDRPEFHIATFIATGTLHENWHERDN